MSFKKIVKSTLLASTLLFSFNTSAVEMDEASWYLNVDLNTIKQSPLKAVLDHKDEDFNKVIDMFMGQEFHDQIQQVTLYGNKEGAEDFSLLIQGNFTQNAKQQLLSHPKIVLEENFIKFNGSRIHHWNINKNTKVVGMEEEIQFDEDESIDLYLAEINPDLIMVSRDLADTKRWLDNDYSLTDISQNGVFSVIVNLQDALAHGGMKVDGDMNLHSQVLNKVSQVSFSVIEDGNEYLFEASLSVADEDTAAQVEQVINGLLALNALSNNTDNPLHQQFMNGLRVERSDLNLIISTSASSDLIISEISKKHHH